MKPESSKKLLTAHCPLPTGYVELHARSAFSFLEGASVPEELIAAALEYEMPAMALLDRNGVYGSPRFHLSGKKKWNQGAYRFGNHGPKSKAKFANRLWTFDFGLWTKTLS